MFESWAIIAIAAAFFQNLRSATQKHLKGNLSNGAAAYSRFLFALPFSLAYLLALHWFAGKTIPATNLVFLTYCLLGGVFQILFTVLLLWMFSFKSFVVGTTFSKLEVVIVAILGAIILQDRLHVFSVVAIVFCTTGVVLLAVNQSGIKVQALAQQLLSRDTATGIACALTLGASVVCFRGASLSLNHNDVIMSAALTLAVALTIQTGLMGIWLSCVEFEQWQKLAHQWKWGLLVGVMAIAASIFWFTAFSMQNAGFVRAVGSIELLFAYLFSRRVFREKVTRMELAGMVLIIAGIVLLLISTK